MYRLSRVGSSLAEKKASQINHNSRYAEFHNIVALICLFYAVVAVSNRCQARLFFTGPNPYLSSRSFPQDGLFFQGTGSYAFLEYNPRGWFGHLDDPRKLPSANYTMTSQNLQLTDPTSNFHLNGNWSQYKVAAVPYYFQYKDLYIQPLFTYELEDLFMNAHGIARSYDDSLGWEQVPFEARLQRKNTLYGIGASLARKFGNTPVGVRMTADRAIWGEPSGYLHTDVDGDQEISNRYTWGWTTQQGCNHILADHANIDAWYQDSYSLGRSWLYNVVAGATVKEHKLGVRYRNYTQYAEEYEYDDISDSYIRDSEWTQRKNEQLLRGYGFFKITSIGRTDLHLVGFAEADRSWTNYVGGGSERLDCHYEKKTLFEVIPVLSTQIGPGFVRGGFDILWGWIGNSNTDIWGQQRVYRQSYPVVGWSRDWERPGYSSGFVLANLIEVDMEYPIIKNPEITLRLELWRMYQITWNTSHFGENEQQGGSYVFQETAVRKDNRKETWMSGLVGAWFGFGHVFGGLLVDLPVTYHSNLSTKVIDHDEGELFYDNQNNFPAVQDPVRVRIMFGRRW